MRRRDFLSNAAFAATALPFSTGLSRLFAADGNAKKILFFTRSQGFEHSPIKFDDNGECPAGKVLSRVGKELGFEVITTKDGTVFDDDLSQYAAFVFYTSGNLDQEGGDGQNPMTEQGVQNFLDAVRGGAGLLGFHSATDTWRTGTGYENDPYYATKEYIRVLGGEFITHGQQQEATVEIVDDSLPSLKARKPSCRMYDEWYANKNFAPDMHVLASLQTAGMENTGPNQCYDRPAFPCVWARKEQKGVALYCAFGHNDSFWSDGEADDLLSDLLKVAVGQVEVSMEPNLARSCPGANILQNSWFNGLENKSDG